MHRLFGVIAGWVLLGTGAGSAAAQHRQDVAFSVSQATVPGQSLFVLGSLPELGGNDLRFAVKLEPSTYPVWKATVSLPVNRSYSYQYYIRNDAPGQGGNAGNGTPVGAVLQGSTVMQPLDPADKTVFVHTTFAEPVLYWRQPAGSGVFQSAAMWDVGPGRFEGERRWAVRDIGVAQSPIEFYLTDVTGVQRDPAGTATYTTPLDVALVQTGNIFNYIPAASVQGQTRGFTPANPPGIQSAFTGEFRRHRVVLPRGYNQHPDRRYPVIYMHDGQNCFDNSTAAFGVEWRADETAAELTRYGRMREAIIVGADNTPNRLNDYAAPDAGGWSNQRYFDYLRLELKPLIDATYRTLTGQEDTGAVGSSMGGQASLFMGWDHTGTYAKIGAFSGAFQVFNSGFYNRVQSQARRDIRLYLDSGDAGASSDNYWPIFNLRDNLINPARAGGAGGAYVLHRDLLHVVGFGQQHNEAAWANRLPGAFSFLFPTSDEPNELLGEPSARPADVNDDDVIDIEDLYAFEQGMPGARSTLDVDRDGVEDEADRGALRRELRGGEVGDTSSR